MNEPGHVAGQVGPLLSLLGVALIALSMILTMVKGGYSTGMSLTPWSPLGRRLRECVRGPVPIPPDELPSLRAAAQVWVGQRWQILFCLGASIAQFGGQLGYPGSRRHAFTAVFTTLMAASAAVTERRARLGRAFLASHPNTGAPGPPEYLGDPQPGSA